MSQANTGPIYEKQMVALGRILPQLQDAETATEAVKIALDHVQRQFDFEAGWVGFYEPGLHRLNTQGLYLPAGMRFVRSHLGLNPGDILEQVVVQQRPLIVADLQNEPRAGEWQALGKQMGLQSAVLFPLRRQGTCLGILLLASPRWGLSLAPGERSHLSMLMALLAETVHQHQLEQQRRQAKRPDQPLLHLLATLSRLDGLDERLQSVAFETQRFVGTRSRIFWFEPQGAYFWQRCSSRQVAPTAGDGRGTAIPMDQVRELYQCLSSDQLVVVGEAHSSLTGAVPERMMQLLKAASLMAAPVLYQGSVRGFLTVEGATSRIWTEPEKCFLQGAARLVALALPTAETEETVAQMRAHQALTAGIVRGIHSDGDWQRTLESCAGQICACLSAPKFWVLMFDRNHGGYELCFQWQMPGVPKTWPGLNDVDWQMLERSEQVAIEDTDHDLKLMAWRDLFHLLEVRSLIICNTAPGSAPEGLIVVADCVSRHWQLSEQRLVEAVARQVGVILHQWQLQRQMDQQAHIYESIQWGLHALQRIFDLDALQENATEHLSKLLQSPLTALVTWSSGEASARVVQAVVRDTNFWVDGDATIAVASDAVVNWALQTDGILPISLEDLPDMSRSWISGPVGSRLLLAALRTAPHHQSTGVLVVMGPPERRWSDYHLQVMGLLANQLAWSRRHLRLVQRLIERRERLEQLNWYKHHQFEELDRLLGQQIERLQDLLEAENGKAPAYLQVLRELESTADRLAPLLEDGPWQLQERYQTAPLASLLNRLIDRLTPIIQERQLWTKVHNQSNLIIGGDVSKLECVVYELLLAAGLRSQPGGRIDIWCRQVDPSWLELSITDDGILESQLVAKINRQQPEDWLLPESSNSQRLHLSICIAFMQQMGSEITLETLEDKRILTRVLLPIASLARRPPAGKPPRRTR